MSSSHEVKAIFSTLTKGGPGPFGPGGVEETVVGGKIEAGLQKRVDRLTALELKLIGGISLDVMIPYWQFAGPLPFILAKAVEKVRMLEGASLFLTAPNQ